MPSLREFLEPVVAEMNPEDAIEEQYKVGFHVVRALAALRAPSQGRGSCLPSGCVR